MNNNDNNVKQLRKRYDIPTNQAPKLLLKGTGDLKGSSVGYKHIEFTFVENKEENIYFTDSINFNPSRGLSMYQAEYKIKSKNLTNNSEETSSVSSISYEIENAKNNGLKQKIVEQIEDLKQSDKFPVILNILIVIPTQILEQRLLLFK